MTPVLLLTDTDVAYPFKAAAARAKAELSRRREAVLIAAEAHDAIVKLNA